MRYFCALFLFSFLLIACESEANDAQLPEGAFVAEVGKVSANAEKIAQCLYGDPSQMSNSWRVFGNGCVDSCAKARSRERMRCSMAMTAGCDCGPDRCWDDAANSCVDN